MRYSHECPACGRVEIEMDMTQYPGSKVWLPCPECGHAYASRVFTTFYFQEDRRHHGGEHWSKSLGRPSPGSRAETRALERQGVVFDSFSQPATAEGKAAAEYDKAVKQGATASEAEQVAPWPQPKLKSFPDFVKEKERKGWSPVEKIKLSG
jgi:hypothetical protein